MLPANVSPFTICAVRGTWISGTFLIIASLKHVKIKFTWKSFLAGMMYALSAVTYIYSLQKLPVAVAAPLHQTSPAFLIIAMIFLYAQYPTKKDAIGVVLSLIGATILIINGGSYSALGTICAIGSAWLWATYLMIQAQLSDTDKIAGAFWGGALMLLMGSTSFSMPSLTINTLLVFVILGIFCSAMPLLLVAIATKNISSISTSLILLLEPAFATVLAFFFNDQTPSATKLVGLILIVSGAVFGILGSARDRRVS
jgi:drug/metabolite transporter (DMT)-like permease